MQQRAFSLSLSLSSFFLKGIERYFIQIDSAHSLACTVSFLVVALACFFQFADFSILLCSCSHIRVFNQADASQLFSKTSELG
jgi:hypothetical protein